MGVFFNAIRDDLGWSAAALGAALSLARIQGGVLAPIVGVVIDRHGPRKLMIIGVLMTGAGFVLLSQTMSIVYFYVVFIVLVQGGISAGMGNAPSSAVVHWFDARRATALGVMQLGISFGGILAKPLAEIITAFGWRTAFMLGGIIVWVVGLPLAFVVRRPRPGDLVEGKPVEEPAFEEVAATGGQVRTTSNRDGEVELSPMTALRTLAFWSIALMFAARHFVTGSVALFLIPLLQERDMSLTDAATILSLMAFIGMPGRVGFAWLGDRMDKRAVIGLCLVFQSSGLILFTLFPGPVGIIAFLILYSPTYSGVLPLIPALQADYFGKKWFATISGMMAPVTTVSVVSGPLSVTAIRDVTGSFQPAFVALAVVNVLALVFVVITRRPRVAEFAPA
jgi:sugar phosphate permease